MQNITERQSIAAFDIIEKIQQVSDNTSVYESTKEYVEYIESMIHEIIVRNIYGDEIVDWGEYQITALHNVDKDCIFDIINNIEEQYFYDKIQENFFVILESKKEKDILNDFLNDINNMSLTELIKKNYLLKVDESSILFKLITFVYSGKNLIESQIKVLKDLWININKNPSIELEEKVEIYIRSIQKTLTELVIWNNYSYIEEGFETRKIH